MKCNNVLAQHSNASDPEHFSITAWVFWKHPFNHTALLTTPLNVLGFSHCHFFAYADSATWVKPQALYIFLYICLRGYISLLFLSLYSTLLQFRSVGGRYGDGARMLRGVGGDACENKRERNRGRQAKPSPLVQV